MNRQSSLLLLLLLVGCSSGTKPVETVAPPADMQALPVCGPWAELGAGVRMRICVDRTITEETGIIRAALVVQNTSAGSASLAAADAKDSLCFWGVDDIPMGGSVPGRTLSLAAGQIWNSPMADVGIPPGQPHRLIRAQVGTKTGDFFATMPITVTPAKWGEPVAGLRLRLGTDREKYTAGEKVAVRLFLHNTTDKPIPVHPLDRFSCNQESRKERLTLSFTTLDEPVAEMAPHAFVTTRLDEPLLLAPGRYRLKATITSKELSALHPIAWVGTVTSNEVEFVVE